MNKPLYYAEAGMVWKRQVGRKTETGTNYTLGFPVCTMHEAVGAYAAEAVAAALNAAEPASDEMLT